MILLLAALVPLSAQAALVVDDASGLRAYLTAASQYAPSLSPVHVGRTLHASVGVNLFTPSEWGLGPGSRVLVFSQDAIGLIAPVKDARLARTQLDAWLAARAGRVGLISRGKLLTASGRGARALLKLLLHPRPLAAPKAPLTWYARLSEPLRTAVMSVEASATGIVARGTVTASAPLLAGPAPAGCEGVFVGCLRAGLGPAGRGALGLIVRQPGLSKAARVEERMNAVDPRDLWPPHPDAVFDGPPGPGPALWGSLDLAQVEAALARLTPLDAVTGESAALGYAAHLLYGELLQHSGPASLTGDPGPKNSTHVEFHLPLH